jgi:hypothetical protein
MKNGKRPNLVVVSDEMRRITVLLGEELSSWPRVRSNPMFGLIAFYRGDTVFALLPAKRAMEKANAIAYKQPRPEHTREGEKWQFFEVESELDIHQALQLLRAAYDSARPAAKNSSTFGRKSKTEPSS